MMVETGFVPSKLGNQGTATRRYKHEHMKYNETQLPGTCPFLFNACNAKPLSQPCHDIFTVAEAF